MKYDPLREIVLNRVLYCDRLTRIPVEVDLEDGVYYIMLPPDFDQYPVEDRNKLSLEINNMMQDFKNYGIEAYIEMGKPSL